MNSVEIWYGRAGQGKSTRILSEIAQLVEDNPFGSPIWWVVPPGASYAAERRLLERLSTVMRVEILTLDRLADKLLSELIGQSPALSSAVSGKRLNQLGRRLLMLRIYEENKQELVLLHREKVTLPFVDSLLMAVDELWDYGINRATVANKGYDGRLLDYHASGVALAKVEELLLLDELYQTAIVEQGLWDRRQTEDALQEALASHPLLRNTVLFFDGFWQWTPQEARFVARLCACSKRSVVALPLDVFENAETAFAEGETKSVTSRFNPAAQRSISHFKNACRDMSVRVVEPQTLSPNASEDAPNRFHQALALQHLESQLFSDVPQVYVGPVDDQIRVIATQNNRVEMVGVAEEIRRLAVADGIPYRDMMILSSYTDESLYNLRDVLEEMKIPYVMDEFPHFVEHPLARFLLAALDVGERGITQEIAETLLESEFPSMPRADADWLLDYSRRHELTDEDWQSSLPWRFATYRAGGKDADVASSRIEQEDERADALRHRLTDNFSPFLLSLSAPQVNLNDLAFALWDLLERVGARTKVAQWMVNEDATLSPLEASLHEQAWEFVIDLLDDSMVVHGFLSLPTQAAISLFQVAIKDHVLSTIPGEMDAVLVTDLGRAEGCEADVVFVLGACDGMFPSRVHPSGLLLDEEREAFFAFTNVRLGLTTEDAQWDSRYDVYQALTRAKRRLYLTYSLSGRDTKAQRPAHVVGEIKALFAHSNLCEQLWTNEIGPTTDDVEVGIWSPERVLRYLSNLLGQGWNQDGQLRGISATAIALIRFVEGDAQMAKRLSTMVAGLAHQPIAGQLLPMTAEGLYREKSTVNVSQLETYAACPFRHFVRYGLRISQDQMKNGTKAFLGTLIHEGLQRFVQRMMEDLDGWRDTDDEVIERTMDGVFDSIKDGGNLAMWRRLAVRDEAIQSVRPLLHQAAKVLTLQMRRGRYEPRAVELKFEAHLGKALSQLGGNHEGAGDLRVVGRIDRVDVATDGSRQAFRILDYKSSPKTLSPTRVMNGLQLQLAVYGAVLEGLSESLLGQRSELAAILYSPIVSRIERVSAPDEAKFTRDALSSMRVAGLFVEDKELVEWMDNALTDPGETSALFPKLYNRDAQVRKGAPVLPTHHWNALLNHVLVQVVDMSRGIAQGRIDIAPYRLDHKETACATCEFSALCHVEKRRNPTVFRDLESVASFETWLASDEGGCQSGESNMV